MNFKTPKVGGVAKAGKSFNKRIKQEPSDQLVRIIEDVLVENERKRKKPDVAAQDQEREANT